MLSIRTAAGFLVLLTTAVACAPAPRAAAPTQEQGAAPSGQAASASVQRALVIIGGRAPESIAARPLRQIRGAGQPTTTFRAFNAGLALNNERNLPGPYLSEALPQLNSETWRVFPDGRMDTTFRLRPGLTWHDGHPLDAGDFVFSYRVYATPDLGLPDVPPFNYIEDVQAPDPATVVVRWRQPYAEAAGLQAEDFPPLPRHLLEATFNLGQPDAFTVLPFWNTGYVGIGPYKLTQFERGGHVEGTAFDGHALGRPRIDQVRLLYMTDPNTALANLLAGSANVATDTSIDLQQAAVLEREWGARNAGTVQRNPVGIRHFNMQMRPEFAAPRAILDLRVRRALAYGTDRQALADGITEGMGSIADSLVLPQVEYAAELERVIAKYPYDLRRTEQLLGEVGYAKGGDGFYTSPGAGRFAMEVMVSQGPRNDTEVEIVADGLRRAGFDARIRIVPRAQQTEPFVFANFATVMIGSWNDAVEPPLKRIRSSEIATQETRGRGNNYSGWNSPEADRLVQAFEAALDRTERNQRIVELLKLVSDEVPMLPLYNNLAFLAYASGLKGPTVTLTSNAATFNLHEWYWER
jgi:peptide/nickel transport system substrate-binding protein